MNKSEFYEKHYFFEHERKYKILGNIRFILSIIIVIGGVLVWLLHNYPFKNFSADTKTFVIFWGFAFILWFISALYLWKAYFGFDYIYIPYLQKVMQFDNALQDYYHKEEIAIERFQQEIDQIYVDATTKNAKSNDEKTGYLQKTKKSLMLSLILLSISIIIYVYKVFNDTIWYLINTLLIHF